MDILAPITMKNAAKCDTQCELQNRESSDLWTQVAIAQAIMFVSVCQVNNIIDYNVIEMNSLTKYEVMSIYLIKRNSH